MPEVKIRIANRGDSKALHAIDGTWKNEGVTPSFSISTEKEFVKAIEKDIIVVAEKQGKIIGYVGGTVKKSTKRDSKKSIIRVDGFGKGGVYIDLGSFYVLKKYRQEGVGKALVRRFIKEVKRRGIKQITLASVNKGNPEALIALYKKLGFRIVVAYMKLDVT
jgi:ribosomal protein S18 acetylase RimI-like enzyme